MITLFFSFKTLAFCIETACLNDVGVIDTAFWRSLRSTRYRLCLENFCASACSFVLTTKPFTKFFVNAEYEFCTKTCQNN